MAGAPERIQANWIGEYPHFENVLKEKASTLILHEWEVFFFFNLHITPGVWPYHNSSSSGESVGFGHHKAFFLGFLLHVMFWLTYMTFWWTVAPSSPSITEYFPAEIIHMWKFVWEAYFKIFCEHFLRIINILCIKKYFWFFFFFTRYVKVCSYLHLFFSSQLLNIY